MNRAARSQPSPPRVEPAAGASEARSPELLAVLDAIGELLLDDLQRQENTGGLTERDAVHGNR